MNRALRKIIHPEETAAERADLRRQLEADLPIVSPVWIATAGGAAYCNSPMKPREADDGQAA
jgi:hypothetical protein